MSGKDLATRDRGTVSRNEGKRGDGTLVMEDARIVFRNFAGVEGQYNREGDRNFCVLLDDDVAEVILETVGEATPLARFAGPAASGNASIVLALSRPVAFDRIRRIGTGAFSVSWVGG